MNRWKFIFLLVILLMVLAALFSLVKGIQSTLIDFETVILWIINLVLAGFLLVIIFLGPWFLGKVLTILNDKFAVKIDQNGKLTGFQDVCIMIIEAAIVGTIWMIGLPILVLTDWSWLRQLWLHNDWRAYESAPVLWGVYAAVSFCISYLFKRSESSSGKTRKS